MGRYDIAIVGMGCVFPDAYSVDQYWKNIRSGRISFDKKPEKLWRLESFFSPDRSRSDKSYTMTGAFIEDFEFPIEKFNLEPSEIEGVDLAQLVTLEAARQALEDAGIAPGDSSLENGVTVLGCSGLDTIAHSTIQLRRHRFFRNLREELEQKGVSSSAIDALEKQFADGLTERGHVWDPKLVSLNAMTSMVSNRVAQAFGVAGYNLTVDAACASSFVALDVACQALIAGDAKVALAGGADLGRNPVIYVGFSRFEGLSLTHSSNPFDHKADGLVIGEGAGVLVLKRVEDALAAGDRIRGVIRGIGSTSDGSGRAIYAPSEEGRVDALRRALSRSQTEPSEVQYLEAHATSTSVGDANEYDTISMVYADDDQRKTPLCLGSVKAQIGHLKAAAGSAGLIKTILAMENGAMPHMPNFEKLTPKAQHPSEQLVVRREPSEWPLGPDQKRVGAVTASGFGGVNYHVIVEQGEHYAAPASRPQVDREIAIIGAEVRTAGADSVERFWKNVTESRDLFSEVDPKALHWEEHWNVGPPEERISTKLISKIDEYKHNLLKYKIFPKAVSQIAPSHLLGLDLADRLLTDGGFDVAAPKNIGVSVGSVHDDNYPEIFEPMIYDELVGVVQSLSAGETVDSDVLADALESAAQKHRLVGPPITEHTLPGLMTNLVAGRMSNKLNLRGPNFTVDTAQSSGVAALIPAVYQLMFGDVDLMISGGLNQSLTDVNVAGLSTTGMVADDEMRPFDAAGKGFLVGEGGVLYLLKRLKDARRDGDNILAVINSIGGASERSMGALYKPSIDGVRRAVREALQQAKLRPEDLGIIDAHGVAVEHCDIVEAKALADEVRPHQNGSPVSITAMSSHLGNLSAGSGAASMLSVIQSLRSHTIPGIRNLEELRPELEALANRAYLAKGTEPLQPAVRYGGVNSLGLGGANFFAVVSDPASPGKVETANTPELSSNLISEKFMHYLEDCEPSVAALLKEVHHRFLASKG